MPSVRVNECDIHYEVQGRGDVVLLLHGLGSSVLDWEMQVPALAERYTVVAVDLRGHGRSGKPAGPYRVAMFADDVARVLGALSLGPAHVVGFSMGGMVGFQLAAFAAPLVRSLVAINSGPAFVPGTLRERIALLARLAVLRVLGLRGLAPRIAALNLPRPDQEALRQKITARLLQNDEAAYRAATRAIIGWSVAEHLGAIRCPTLFLSSDQDYTPVAAKQAFAERMPRARVTVVPGSRHLTPLDQPEEVNRLLLDFLSEV